MNQSGGKDRTVTAPSPNRPGFGGQGGILHQEQVFEARNKVIQEAVLTIIIGLLQNASSHVNSFRVAL